MTAPKPSHKIATVDDYIASQPASAVAALKRVRQAIRRAVPSAEESISYNIPTYGLGGSPLLYFAGWKKHYSLYPVTSELLALLESKPVFFEVHKGTVRFPLDQPVPVSLIAEIARLRVQALGSASRTSAKKASKTSREASRPKVR